MSITVPHPLRDLAGGIRRAARGPQWHGPALGELLRGVSAEQASGHPIAGAHSIWELVLHVTAWAEIVERRLRGEGLGAPTAEGDWPPVPDAATEAAWTEAVERLLLAHDTLAAAVRTLDPGLLAREVPGQPEGNRHSHGVMLAGVVEHAAYHGGQIAILKRALG